MLFIIERTVLECHICKCQLVGGCFIRGIGEQDFLCRCLGSTTKKEMGTDEGDHWDLPCVFLIIFKYRMRLGMDVDDAHTHTHTRTSMEII